MQLIWNKNNDDNYIKIPIVLAEILFIYNEEYT